MAHPLLIAARMTLKHVCAFLAVVGAGCAMKMNGKTVGFGGDSSTASASPGGSGSSSSGTAASDSSGDEESSDPQARGHYKNYPRYPEAPVDPLLSVKDGKPVVVEAVDWQVRASEGTECTAVRDHCIDPRTWFYEDDIGRDGKNKGARRVVLGTFTTDGVEGPHNSRSVGILNEANPYTAYKTVPATRKNIEKGTLVVAMAYPAVTPAHGAAPFDDIYWHIGVIDHIDWDLMKVYLVGSEDDSLAIAATRVAVLSYRPGEKVVILGGKKANEIQVKAADVILPEAPAQ